MPVHPFDSLANCNLDSRTIIIRQEIEDQIDMQLGLTLRDWNQKIDEALQPKGRVMIERALVHCFPFAAPQMLQQATVWADYATYLVQRTARPNEQATLV